MRALVLLLAISTTAAADPRPPLDPDDVYAADRGLVCWEVPRANGCNNHGCWTDGGGCNLYGCGCPRPPRKHALHRGANACR